MKPLLHTIIFKLILSSLFIIPASFAEVDLEEVIVTSDFRESQLKNIPTSISVIDSKVINQRNSRHLEELLALAPNVNFAAGASRGKYFQIRGIGERSQFVAPLNPSVGTYVDGIDFTGFGGAATLLDIDQVEVLRGSQGTRFGANALAGVITLKSVDPSTDSQGYIKNSASSYNSSNLEAAVGGSLDDQLQYRVAVGKTTSDGFIKNTTVNRKDTNNIDEATSRLKLRYLAADNLTIDFTALHLDIDNGYDGFSLDENRTTMSDQPGHDRQKSTAFAVKSNWEKSDAISIKSIFTSNRTDAKYGFDEDWTDPEFQPGYQAFDNYSRDIARDSAEIRWVSGPEGQIADSDWLIGVYHQKSTIDLTRDYTYDSIFTSQYDTSSSSVFAQVSSSLQDNLALTSGLRFEKWKSDYSDSNQIGGRNNENLVGGKLALELATETNDLIYLSLTRGYKAGGYNGEVNLPSESDRHFDTEYQWNYEIGRKIYSPDRDMINRITAFYTDRQDLQLKSSTAVVNDGGAASFVDFNTNAGKGYSYGVEWEMTWQLDDSLSLTSSLGLLKTKITEHISDPDAFNLDNRAAAHAPEYTFATSAQYAFTNRLSATLELEGKDKFYYSDSHNYQSQAYKLVNARLAYIADGYELTAFVNNATNKDYGVRGFAGWDADPRSGVGFDETEFQQLGAPKVAGISARADF
ncbi:MAG: TonB-dependent receptor [Porticoccaceae bacterium]|nr:TonB-dependent receptor [Porticoccaceae bacterium]